MVELVRHPYKYFPYELELAGRELRALLPQSKPSRTASGYQLNGTFDSQNIDRLVYFAGFVDGDKCVPTIQSLLEQVDGGSVRRQSTRYSAHGLHEYKGKFNPQIVRAIFNIFEIAKGSRVIDPFCGSGTSLLESAHVGMDATGTDINPLAIFIANSKLLALGTSASVLLEGLRKSVRNAGKVKLPQDSCRSERRRYLLSWFQSDIYETIEKLRISIEGLNSPASAPLLAIASNLLREYSQQDPNDLRIRRRKSALPVESFMIAFESAALRFLDKLVAAQKVLDIGVITSRAILTDSRNLSLNALGAPDKFDCALTSPPYATALPYIDTQRLSLVWLGLISPDEILSLEATLVGSRETRGFAKKSLIDQVMTNSANIPNRQARYCKKLQDAVGSGDGFRRQAVPRLLYRYFVGMQQVFLSLRPLMNARAPFALIVGGNHSVLGGVRFDIDTPKHIAELAVHAGWRHIETIPLQTYQRYGYHAGNAVASEAMVILRAS